MRLVKTILLSGGHYHDFEQGSQILCDLMKSFGRFNVVVTEDRSILRRLDGFDLLVMYTQGGDPTPSQEEGLLRFVKKGGGLVGIHSASDTFRQSRAFVRMLGGAFSSHGPLQEFEVTPSSGEDYLNQRLRPFRIKDELYLLEKFDSKNAKVSCSTRWQGKLHPMAYTKSFGKGRVAYIALGHNPSSLRNPGFQKLFLRALDWAARNEGRKAKTINVGVIGYGAYMGRIHIEMMSKTGVFHALAVCDKDPSRVQQARRDFPGIKTYRSIDAMISRAPVDMCVVCLPHNLHMPVVIRCLEAGKDVVCEKPMAVTADECTRMIEAAEKAGKILSINHNRRYDPFFFILKEIIASGAIGSIFHIEAFVGSYCAPPSTWRSEKETSGGCLHDWGAHLVDWCFGLLGEKALSVTGFFHKRFWFEVSNDDEASAIIRFASGAEARVTVSNLSCAPKPLFIIRGTTGSILMPDWETIKIYRSTPVGPAETTLKVREQGWFTDWSTFYFDLADHIFLGDKNPCTPEEGRRVIEVIKKAETSSRTGLSQRLIFG